MKMNWKLPNQLTIGRIVLAAVFFVLLGIYNQNEAGSQTTLNVAFWIFVVAGITDILDGWIARKFKWTSAFGRIVDPFVDKVLVVGAFIMLAGQNFSASFCHISQVEKDLPSWMTGHMASAVQSWMVVAILAREFIVSAVRGYSESIGMKFPAAPAGKIKMLVQSVAIGAVLYQMANLPETPWAVYLKIIMVWLTVNVTVLSGLAYIGKARKAFTADDVKSEQ